MQTLLHAAPAAPRPARSPLVTTPEFLDAAILWNAARRLHETCSDAAFERRRPGADPHVQESLEPFRRLHAGTGPRDVQACRDTCRTEADRAAAAGIAPRAFNRFRAALAADQSEPIDPRAAAFALLQACDQTATAAVDPAADPAVRLIVDRVLRHPGFRPDAEHGDA